MLYETSDVGGGGSPAGISSSLSLHMHLESDSNHASNHQTQKSKEITTVKATEQDKGFGFEQHLSPTTKMYSAPYRFEYFNKGKWKCSQPNESN